MLLAFSSYFHSSVPLSALSQLAWRPTFLSTESAKGFPGPNLCVLLLAWLVTCSVNADKLCNLLYSIFPGRGAGPLCVWRAMSHRNGVQLAVLVRRLTAQHNLMTRRSWWATLALFILSFNEEVQMPGRCHEVVRRALGSRVRGQESTLSHWLAGESQATASTSLSFSFIICKMRTLVWKEHQSSTVWNLDHYAWRLELGLSKSTQ